MDARARDELFCAVREAALAVYGDRLAAACLGRLLGGSGPA